MNYKLYTPILVLVGILASSLGYSWMSTKPATSQAFPMAPTGYSHAPQDTRTPDQVLAAEVRGNLRTMPIHSGKVVGNGSITLLNNTHYKEGACVPCKVPTHLLPPGATPELLKGKTIITEGVPSLYQNKRQWDVIKVVEIK